MAEAELEQSTPAENTGNSTAGEGGDKASATEVRPAEGTKPAANTGGERRGGPNPERRGGSEERRGGPRNEGRGGGPGGAQGGGGNRPNDRNRGGNDRGERGDRGDRGGRSGDRPGGERRGESSPEIDLEKLIADSLYLDNQAHVVVSRMRDMDSGTKSQLRRLYNAVRRATRTPEGERQHEFVMVRARLAYTIARHSLRSLDALERLLLQVTRKNDSRGYERFRDLFEAIIAYNE